MYILATIQEYVNIFLLYDDNDNEKNPMRLCVAILWPG
jgi:hypothetical protein